MFEYAQTNLQLFNQLRELGWSEEQLVRTQRAYDLASRLFAAQFRPSGKTFVAHLVGVASILAAHDVDEDIVLAGLLHAAYKHGEFGTGQTGATPDKRKFLVDVVGTRVEEIVYDYPGVHVATWTNEGVSNRLSGLSPTQREASLITVANELEECLDLGTAYRGQPGVLLTLETLSIARNIARELAVPAFVPELEEHEKRIRSAKIPCGLITDRHRSYTVDPLPLRQRLRRAAHHKLSQLAQRTKRQKDFDP